MIPAAFDPADRGDCGRCGGRDHVNASMRVHGTVLDSMTGKPVVNATISTGGRIATADVKGAFVFDRVEKECHRHDRRDQYTSTEIKATGTAATVRLAPIAVHATVTSALTAGGLPAALILPDGTP
jgi:hypothetical protein